MCVFILFFIRLKTVNNSRGSEYDDLDFRLVVDSKSGPPLVIILVAPTLQDKAAWTSDISQVSVNFHFFGEVERDLCQRDITCTLHEKVQAVPSI